MSPSSDIVGPSPVTSNGTEIEDEATEETAEQANLDAAPPPQVTPQDAVRPYAWY